MTPRVYPLRRDGVSTGCGVSAVSGCPSQRIDSGAGGEDLFPSVSTFW
jgi:hypothetical protein